MQRNIIPTTHLKLNNELVEDSEHVACVHLVGVLPEVLHHLVERLHGGCLKAGHGLHLTGGTSDEFLWETQER